MPSECTRGAFLYTIPHDRGRWHAAGSEMEQTDLKSTGSAVSVADTNAKAMRPNMIPEAQLTITTNTVMKFSNWLNIP